MVTLGVLGGTGPLGRGLALRLARAGHRVLLGSRDADRGKEAAASLTSDHIGLAVRGGDNVEVTGAADLVIVAVPFGGLAPTLRQVAEAVGEKIVVSTVVGLERDSQGPRPAAVEEGSAAQLCQAMLPQARVVGAFHHVSAVTLLGPDEVVDSDVLLVADDAEAREEVAGLVGDIPGLRPVHAGPLRLASALEAFTAVLVAVNRHYRAHSGLRITAIDGATHSA